MAGSCLRGAGVRVVEKRGGAIEHAAGQLLAGLEKVESGDFVGVVCRGRRDTARGSTVHSLILLACQDCVGSQQGSLCTATTAPPSFDCSPSRPTAFLHPSATGTPLLSLLTLWRACSRLITYTGNLYASPALSRWSSSPSYARGASPPSLSPSRKQC